jgi:hypothetical protein
MASAALPAMACWKMPRLGRKTICCPWGSAKAAASKEISPKIRPLSYDDVELPRGVCAINCAKSKTGISAQNALSRFFPCTLKTGTVECVGLIPAGGKAERISPLPCSKEIFPVGFGEIRQNNNCAPKWPPTISWKNASGGCGKSYIVLSKGKWDIPAYFGNGSMVNMALGYLMTDHPYGVPFTLDSAFPF